MFISKRKILLLGGDLLLLYLSLFLTLFFRNLGNFSWEIFEKHLIPFSILYFVYITIFYIFGFYDLSLFRTFFVLSARILGGLGLCLGLGIAFFYLIPFFGISPKTNLVLDILIFGLLIFCWRWLFYSLFASHFQSRVAIIGKNPQSEELAFIIQKNPHLGYAFVAFLDPKEDLFRQIKEKEINTIILTENLTPDSPLTQNLYQCFPLRLNFLDLAEAYEIISEKIPVSFINQIWFLENIKEVEKRFYEIVKRLMDIILATFLLLITSPLWVFISLAIKLEDRGSVFYKQERIGRDKKPFLLIKFRSMKEGAEKETGAVWAEKDDQRTTKVGKILRQTHLDEIPQMINVLKGDISLVGPRPERPEFVAQLEKEIPHYHLRHLIKPGFTGWAQIKFRYARTIMDSLEKFQYDLYYLKNRSLFLDLRILLKTFQLFFKRE